MSSRSACTASVWLRQAPTGSSSTDGPAGNVTPATYRINGKQFVVIVCGGGKNGAPSGSSIVAFALP